ncbi:MAG: 5-methyltetrahydrofolate--homocysteine methyltransferase, partial [Candidatus Cloacimonadota bacterium]
ERINPTGKKKMTEDIEKGATAAIRNEAKSQAEAGASVLDLNLGMESGIEEDWLRYLVTNLLVSPGLPLSLDLRSENLIEAALQEYGGRPLFNSITIKDMESKVKLLIRYGGMAVFLPIDESGISKTAEKRAALAKRAINHLSEMGFNKNRILFDPIVMSLATGNAPRITLETLKSYKKLGLLTVLGLSNISYGLPHRASINKYFLNLCVDIGLNAVIMNPLEKEKVTDLDLSPVFSGKKNIMEFLKETKVAKKEKIMPGKEKKEVNLLTTLIGGDKEKTLSLIKGLLKKIDYEKVIEDVLRPALDQVGRLYEKREIFLPQLIMAAETAQTAFGFIEKKFAKKRRGEGQVIIATVRGDIHDIGKNIVAMMLKNAGFDVTDLGKDVPSKDIVKIAKENNANVIALSALMTTTALKMKEVIELTRKKEVSTKVIIGGACITKKFADDIGADAYAKDASEAVKEVRRLMGKK